MEIDDTLYKKLESLGLIPNPTRSYNVGESNYSEHIIQPWSIWLDYNLNAFDADILKRVLRTKSTDSRKMDYEKIIHICLERLRQMGYVYNAPVLVSFPKTCPIDDAQILGVGAEGTFYE